MTLRFREAVPGDEVFVVQAVRGIAEAEGLLHKVLAGEADYRRLLFGDCPVLTGVIADRADAPVGCVLWHPIVATYSGRLGIFIEDIFVDPAHRGDGVGRALMAEMARRAVQGGYDRLVWTCKNDNVPAIGFYDRLGAERLADYTNHRLSGDALAAMAQG